MKTEKLTKDREKTKRLIAYFALFFFLEKRKQVYLELVGRTQNLSCLLTLTENLRNTRLH